jgi:protein arginine N-methyltransferase 1
MSLLIDAHRQFLEDAVRLDAFSRAIAEAVRPGDVVVDLGSGTGVLGLLACRAGASRVYSVDQTGMAAFARRIAADNGFSDRVVALRGHSSRVDLPERADVVVSDMIGRIGFHSGSAEALIDVRERWLKPGGWLMPASVETWIAPVEHSRLHADVDFWSSPIAGFDMSAVRQSAANTGYPYAFDRSQLLAAGAVGARCDYRSGDASLARGTASFVVERAGVLHGLAAWFVAQLSASVSMTNAPGAPDRINRRNAFLPLENPVTVAAGDVVEVTLAIRPADFVVSWSVRCVRGAVELGAAQQSTLRGMLLEREDLVSAAERSKPTLNRWAAARATIIELCDGERELGEIERLVFERHGGLFANAMQAKVFVAEVVGRYAETPPARLA